ncbi:MAG: lysophospholipid acyltransferase family protein [Bacteroidaceae bacterium]|nr:lysophospholipid acyltransferase family protein [Bacteroidaceae bacterium]
MKQMLALMRALAWLPLPVLYALSDGAFLFFYHVVRYRRRVVRQQVTECFPEKSAREIVELERRFYHYLCDLIVEIVKLPRMPLEEVNRRIEWVGIDTLVESLETEQRATCVACLGHLGCWEWLVSVAQHVPADLTVGQVYHPLRNQDVDAHFLTMRSRFGGVNIPMKQTYEHIAAMQATGQREVVVLLSDQCPKFKSMYHWCDFLHHKTSFYMGSERISKQTDATVVYLDVTRPRRGYYRAAIVPITSTPQETEEFEITNAFVQLLEDNIRRQPEIWLWTHKRWKRTYEEWVEWKENNRK